MAVIFCNIEPGDRICKVCVGEQRGKQYQINNAFLFETPDGAVQDGQIMDVESISEAIKKHLAVHRQKGIKNVNFIVNSSRVVSREVILPAVKEARIKMTVETNAAEYFPVDITNYSIASCVLEHLTDENSGWRVRVVAVPENILEGYSALADYLGMRLGNIDYCGNSQYQLLRSVKNGDVVLYVDVNDGNTFVSFIKDGELLLQRNIAAGGGELIRELMTADREETYLNVLKKAAHGNYVDSLVDDESYRSCLDRVVAGIARSEDYFTSGYPHLRVGKVVLMGLCSNIAGLRETVSDVLGGVETVILHELEGVKFTDTVDGIGTYINCIGVLVSPMKLFAADMRIGEKSKRKSSSDSLVGSILICALCLAAGIGLAVGATVKYYGALAEEKKLQKRYDELLYVEDVYGTYIGYEQTKDNLDIIRACSDTPTSEICAFLEEMEEKMPVGMTLMSASGNYDGITLNITCTGLEEADVIISRLRGFRSICTMKVSTVTEAVDENGVTVAAFSVNCGFVPVVEETFPDTATTDAAE